MFLGEDVPAAGFSLGLERILVVMADRSMFPPHLTSAPADVMVTLWSTAGRAAAVSLAGELRAAGLRVEVYPEADRIGKQFKYAAGRGVPLVAVLGDDEAARGEVSIKDLRSGEQHAVPRPAVATALRDRLAASPVPGSAGGAAGTRG
jgi:histidyl-tRNA synthetase